MTGDQPTTFTRADDDDQPMIYLPAGAQIHHHDPRTEIPETWTWFRGKSKDET